MGKTVTINQNYEFRRLYARGKYFTSPVLITYYMKNRLGIRRIGITASKKVGKATVRNRARRVILAAYRQLAPEATGGWDLVFVARTRTPEVKSTDIQRVMAHHLRSAGII